MQATQPAPNLRELANRTAGLEARLRRLTTPVVQEFAGDGSQTDFTCTKGYKPFLVFSGGSLMREGSSEDYEVTFDGFAYTVSFAVAPSTVDVTIVSMGAF